MYNLYNTLHTTKERGMQGMQGIIGPAGKQGLQGLTGEQGLDGLKGDQGEQGLQGLTGLQGEQGLQGLTGLQGEKGLTGLQGEQGLQGLTGLQGEKGEQGEKGLDGLQGEQGEKGLDGLQGLTGEQGLTGLQGEKGEQGLTGEQGIKGDQGIPGQNAAISSIFVWSGALQQNLNITKFQYVTFEKPLIGPSGSGWTTTTQSGYTNPTNFIVPANGFYLLTYKIDVRSGGNSSPTSNNDSSTVLTVNGQVIPGSTTLVEAPQENHIYTISNTVLCDLSMNDSVALLFWSTDIGAHIGDPSFVKGLLPSGVVPAEATASIVFTRIN